MRTKFAARAGLTLLELVMVVSILAVLTAMVVPGMSSQQEETRKTVARSSLNDLRNAITNRYLQDMTDLPRARADDTTRASETVGAVARPLPQLHFLFVNPNSYVSTATPPYPALNDYDHQTRLGWNGPYVMTSPGKYPTPTAQRSVKNPNDTRTWADYGFTTSYGNAGDQTLLDPWGSPYVLVTYDYTHGAAALRSEYLVSAGPNLKLDHATWAINTDGSLNSGDDLVLLVRTDADPNP